MDPLASFIVNVLSQLFANLVSWLISRIATRAGADDLVFMITERIQQRRPLPAFALAHSLYAAIVDRLFWIATRLGRIDAAEALSQTFARYESLFFFCGIALVIGSGMNYCTLGIQKLFLRFFPWWHFGMASIVACGLYIVLLWLALRAASAILEMPAESMFRGRVFMSAAFGMIGIIAAWSEIDHLGGAGFLTVALWLAIAFGLAIVRSVVVERQREARRAKAAYWGPGGRPIAFRDVRYMFPVIVADQNRRRGRVRW